MRNEPISGVFRDTERETLHGETLKDNPPSPCPGLARFAYRMLLPSMGKALALGYDQMGFIGTGNFAGYLLAVGLSPFLMHGWGGRRTITLGLFLLAVCMVLIGLGAGFVPVPGL